MNIFDIRIEDNNKVYRWSWEEMVGTEFKVISITEDGSIIKPGDIVKVIKTDGHYVLYREGDRCWRNCKFTDGWVLERIKA